MKHVTPKQLKMIYDLIEYIEESEAQDFREHCNDNSYDVSDVYDENITQHIYQTASILRVLLGDI